MGEQRKDVIVLQMVRLSFPKLWKAEASTPESKPKFGASFLIDPTTAEGKANLKRLNALIEQVKKDTWAEKADKIYNAIEDKRKLLRDGDNATNSEGDVYDGYEGMMYVSASNQKRPQILNRDKSTLAEEDGVIYGGCYVDAVISVYAVTKKEQGGNGMFATVEVVRFRKDGEAFGAGPIDADDYLDDLPDDDDEDIV